MGDGSVFWTVWNAAEGRPRAGIRIYVQFLLRSVVIAVVGVPATVFFLRAVSGTPAARVELGTTADALGSRLATIGMVTLCTVFCVWVGGRYVDRRPLREFGLRVDGWWVIDLLFGFALGGVLMAGVFAVLVLGGWATVTGVFEGGWGSPFRVLAPPAVFLCVGVWEELFYRGYVLKNLAEGLNFDAFGARRAVLVSWVAISVLFGAMHLSNPGASALAAANIAAAGLMLGLPYVLTGELAAPIGLHIGWNLFQSSVFGFPVSGIAPDGATVFSLETSGSAIVGGGAFGPEGGLVGLAAFASGCVLIIGWAWLKGTLRISEKVARPPARARSAGHSSSSPSRGGG